jgi:hypothetical protein
MWTPVYNGHLKIKQNISINITKEQHKNLKMEPKAHNWIPSFKIIKMFVNEVPQPK